jgi:hypothetical protein
LNCRLYSAGAHNHCLSPTTEYVADVARANFCEEFEFTARKRAPNTSDEGRRRFEGLFGD